MKKLVIVAAISYLLFVFVTSFNIDRLQQKVNKLEKQVKALQQGK